MKKKGLIIVSLFAGILLIASFLPKPSQNEGKEAVLVKTVLNYVEQLHFRPKSLDDKLSDQLFNYYIESIDGGKRFLTKEDLAKLENHRFNLDNQATEGTFTFFDLSIDLLDKSLRKTQVFYRELLSKPFNLNGDATFETDSDKRPFPANDAELKEVWRKLLVYEIISRVNEKLEIQGKGSAEIKAKSTEELEKEAREAVLKLYDEWYERLFKTKRSDRLSIYINSLTHLYDPHSDFFEPIEKQNFDIRFTGKLEGIGATLQTVGDYTKVATVVVGGPAWKTKEIFENDIILKVAQEGADFKDISGMVINDVVQQIRGKKGTKVRLLVKKVDGTIKEIEITRDIIELEEGFAKSLLLKNDQLPNDKYGYIYLPRFYADFEDPKGRFCAPDVEKEIEKLKAENVKGIILDLRNNGGGSLSDVVKMTGFFIPSGPVVQVKSKESKADVLRDPDSRTQYDGALIVMVNNMSASASEIIAAALQDYGRAIIVGTKSTYGKGTVQRFFDLDMGLRGYEEFKPLGEVKITTQKFYRINGGSTQLKGVTPDIILPDQYHYLEIGEREEDYAMEWTEIAPVGYEPQKSRLQSLDLLRKKSEDRVKSDPSFQMVLKNALRIKKQRDQSIMPLSLNAYKQLLKNQEKEAQEFRDAFKNYQIKSVENLATDLAEINADSAKITRNIAFKESVGKDIYLRESLLILNDYIRLKK
jgi:carboxyl-terminal processing protease